MAPMVRDVAAMKEAFSSVSASFLVSSVVLSSLFSSSGLVGSGSGTAGNVPVPEPKAISFALLALVSLKLTIYILQSKSLPSSTLKSASLSAIKALIAPQYTVRVPVSSLSSTAERLPSESLNQLSTISSVTPGSALNFIFI